MKVRIRRTVIRVMETSFRGGVPIHSLVFVSMAGVWLMYEEW